MKSQVSNNTDYSREFLWYDVARQSYIVDYTPLRNDTLNIIFVNP